MSLSSDDDVVNVDDEEEWQLYLFSTPNSMSDVNEGLSLSQSSS